MLKRYRERRQVTKLLEAYILEYDKLVPEGIIARDEILQLKRLNLQEIAAQYDSLQGWRFAKKVETAPGKQVELIPTASRYCPPWEYVTRPTTKAQKLVRVVRHYNLMKEFHIIAPYEDTKRYFKEDPLATLYNHQNPRSTRTDSMGPL